MTDQVHDITSLPVEPKIRFNKKFIAIAAATTVAVVGAVFVLSKLNSDDETENVDA